VSEGTTFAEKVSVPQEELNRLGWPWIITPLFSLPSEDQVLQSAGVK